MLTFRVNEATIANKRDAEVAKGGTRFKHYTLRPPIVPDQRTSVITNHFKVEIPAGKVLYEYHVEGIPSSATRAKRKMFILDMIEIDRDLFNARGELATDCKKKIITCKPLFNVDSEPTSGQIVRQVIVNDFESGNRGEPKQRSLEVVFAKKHSLDGLKGFVGGFDEPYEDVGAKEALNIVIAKGITDDGVSSSQQVASGTPSRGNVFQVGDNRFYFRPGHEELDNSSKGLLAIRGYFSSIRPAMGSILLNVNNTTSAFYKPQRLDEFMDRRSILHLQFLKYHLCGLRVRVNFSRSGVDGQGPEIDSEARRTKTLCDLGGKPRGQTLQKNLPSETVWDHLRSKYNLSSNYNLDLPTGNVGRKQAPNQNFYLAEQLDVLSDQPYRGTLSPEETAKMIKIAKKRPEENYGAIVGEGLQCLKLDNPAQLPNLLQSLGLRVSPNLLEVPARQIAQPRIMYKNASGHLFPVKQHPNDHGFWTMQPGAKFTNTRRRFGDTAGATAKVRFFKLKEKTMYRDNGDFLKRYTARFLVVQTQYGEQQLLLANSNIVDIDVWTPEGLKSTLQAPQNKCDLAVLILPVNDSEQRQRYTNFRIVADQLLGIKSIGMCEQKIVAILTREAEKARGTFNSSAINLPSSKGMNDYFRNIAMKLNLRCGNVNHVLQSGTSFPKIGGSLDTIIIGADVTHPGAASLDGTPSIAAVVGTVDGTFARYTGHVRLNTSRKDIIDDMESMVFDLLSYWYEQNNSKLPNNILFYRDGVGHSQYAEVREREITAIKSAWTKLNDKEREWTQPGKASKSKASGTNLSNSPQITAVVVTKRHNSRIYPKVKPGPNQKSFNPSLTTSGNCLPGTVVDSSITHPYYFDFYLLSHTVPGKSGTARPTHYFVLQNGMEFTPKEIQDLTFNLCFTWGRSLSSVSYVPATYYADRLCERVRLYLQPFLDEVPDLRNQNLTYEQVFKRAADLFYRGAGEKRTEGAPANPWHKNLEGTMFWM